MTNEEMKQKISEIRDVLMNFYDANYTEQSGVILFMKDFNHMHWEKPDLITDDFFPHISDVMWDLAQEQKYLSILIDVLIDIEEKLDKEIREAQKPLVFGGDEDGME